MSLQTTSRAGRAAAQSATVVTSGLLLLGLGAGTAGAHAAPKAESPSGGEKQQAAPVQSPTGGDKQQAANHGSHDGDHNALVDLSHNQIPIQICHNQIPVNVLGVQVPVKDVDAALGLGLAGSEGEAPVIDDSSCHQPAAQQN